MWLYDFLIFYNAGLSVLNGTSPYQIFDYNSPFFLSLFFVPFAILPLYLAYIVFVFINLLILWKLMKKKAIWVLLSFPFLFSIFVGQIDLLLAGIILLGSPWTIAFALMKPQVGFVVVPWILMSLDKQGWIKAISSTAIFVLISFIVRPTWVQEWFATQPAFSFFSSHASNLYWLIPKENLAIRATVTMIFALIILPISFVLKERKFSWTILHLFAPLTNIYSPVVLFEWIGPIEVFLSWLAVLFVMGNIHQGMPLFLMGISIMVRGIRNKDRVQPVLQ